jgi:hypothetical protein
MSLQDSTVIFTGYFSVASSYVTGFYETINGSTDFNNNILVTPLTIYITMGYPTNPATGFLIYNLYGQFINGITVARDIIVDNGYNSSTNPNYPNFMPYGIALKSMSYYPESLGSPTLFQLYAARSSPYTNYTIWSSQTGQKVFNISLAISPVSNPNTLCFKEDTKILTNLGYIPIQDLRKGDLVKTLRHEYKPIDMIGKREFYHTVSQERILDQLYQFSKTEYPEIFEPLVITGGHSILIDKFINEEQMVKVMRMNDSEKNILYTTDDKFRLFACLDEKASVYNIPGIYTVYHFALESEDSYINFGIYANGLLVETCSKKYLKEQFTTNLIE